jgi:hypothetical protein
LLKNLEDELRNQDQTLRVALKRRICDYPLIVVGYSGRDQSVMELLKAAYTESLYGNGRLYWCGTADEPSDRVTEMLLVARQNGNQADYVPGVTFDDFLVRLSEYWLRGDLLKESHRIVSSCAAEELKTAAGASEAAEGSPGDNGPGDDEFKNGVIFRITRDTQFVSGSKREDVMRVGRVSIRKPAPVIERPTGQSYASMNLAGLLLARAAS